MHVVLNHSNGACRVIKFILQKIFYQENEQNRIKKFKKHIYELKSY